MSRTYAQVAVRITLILSVVAFLLYAVVVRGELGGNTFATGSGQGGIELLIDSKTYYNNVLQPKLTWALKDLKPNHDRFFKFLDVKPGDFGKNRVSIHVKKNSAYVCLDFVNLKDKENGNNEPESHEDANGAVGGELSSALEFFGWMDDGDIVYEVGERILFGTSTQAATTTLRGRTYAIADSKNGTAIPTNQTKYVSVLWCAGDLTVSTTTGAVSCNGSLLGNGVQTDSMYVDVSLRAVASKEQKNFQCVKDAPKKGNNGHGNDKDHNDNSNPGNSNDPDDDTDDDGYPRGQDGNHHNDDDESEWHQIKGGGLTWFWSKLKQWIRV